MRLGAASGSAHKIVIKGRHFRVHAGVQGSSRLNSPERSLTVAQALLNLCQSSESNGKVVFKQLLFILVLKMEG